MLKRTRKKGRTRPRRTEAKAIVLKPEPQKPQVVVASPEPATEAIALPRAGSELQPPVLVYLARLGTDKSRASIRDALKRVLRVLQVVDDKGEPIDIHLFPWQSLTYDALEMVRTRLSAECSPSTASHALCAVRGVLKVAWKQRRIDTDTYHRAASIEGVRGSRLPAGRHVEETEIRALFEACGEGALGARNSATLGLLYGCGLRRNEAAEARIENLELSTKSLTVIGKGNKEREVFLPPGAFQAVNRWIQEYRGELPGPILCAVLKGKPTGRGITDEAIRKIVQAVQDRAGVKHLSPHDLRRSYIGALLDAGADISTVQKLAGHASPTTTSRYDRRGEHAKRKATNMLDVPYTEAKDEDEGEEE